MKNRKMIVLIVLLLAVGFAAVSTTLFINGQTSINANQDDFNVYYSDAYVNGVQDKSVITDDTHIVFETELNTLGQKYVLDYEVTNGSKNYDAELVMSCTGGNDYLTVTNLFDDETILEAKDSREGVLTLELTKSYSGEDLSVSIECTISANAVERDSLGVSNRSEITVEAKDENNIDLNAKAYEITGSDETKLLNSLVETGYVSEVSDVDALIEVESDEFDRLATTTFDVSSIASEGDKVVILHFNEETQEWEYVSEEIVDSNGKITADFSSYSPVAFVVVKEDGTFEVISMVFEIGEEVVIDSEKFNIVSQTADMVTLLAQYNLSTSYKQSITANKVTFSSGRGWSYTPGPQEIDIEIWSTNPKNYINEYLTFIKGELEDTTITGNLMTLNELKKLGCTITSDYTAASGLTCENSIYKEWLVNNQIWWTRSARPDYAHGVWCISETGVLNNIRYDNISGIRPTITISKDSLLQYKKKQEAYKIGYESRIKDEVFNLISVSDDTVTLLASNVLGTNYRQTSSTLHDGYSVKFANTHGWEYTPGPKEIDIYTWSTNPKNYINEYVAYLKEQINSTSVSGNLITLAELKKLGCTIKDDYSNVEGLTCNNSEHSDWLVNGQHWWTRSTYPVYFYDIWLVNGSGNLIYSDYGYASAGIRPIITISKEVYEDLVF